MNIGEIGHGLLIQESLKIMNQNKLNLQKHLGHLGMNISHTQSYTQADKESGEC